MSEVWEDIAGYEGIYQVSNQGQVRSLDRDRPYKDGTRKIRGVTLKQAIREDGYHQVSLWKEGVHANGLVHQLVAEAFLGPCPVGQQVRHREGDRDDNRAVALLYGTQSDNNHDTVHHGRHHFSNRDQAGEANENAKLTLENVREIRRRIAAGVRMKLLAIDYDVSYSLIKQINRREVWPDAG